MENNDMMAPANDMEMNMDAKSQMSAGKKSASNKSQGQKSNKSASQKSNKNMENMDNMDNNDDMNNADENTSMMGGAAAAGGAAAGDALGLNAFGGDDGSDNTVQRKPVRTDCCCCLCQCSNELTEGVKCCFCFPIRSGIVIIGILIFFIALNQFL